MTKMEFLAAIRARLAGLPEESLAQALDYYAEMIDDRVEDGMSEADAVAAMGEVEAAAEQILMGTPLPKLVRERVRPKRRLRVWEIALLVLGSPVWLPLAAAAAVVAAVCYGVLWILVACGYVVVAALAVGALGGLVGAAAQFVMGTRTDGLILLGCGLMCAGLSALGLLGCNVCARGAARYTRAAALRIRAAFLKKETEQ